MRDQALPIERRHFAASYLGVIAMTNLLWEFLQMPLYTVWKAGSVPAIIYDAFHCTVGDVLISATTLAATWVLVRRTGWPRTHRVPAAVFAIALGLIYTVFSEWLNVSVRQSWAYSELMPLFPGTKLGLAPLAQWIIVPAAGFFAAYRQIRSQLTPSGN